MYHGFKYSKNTQYRLEQSFQHERTG